VVTMEPPAIMTPLIGPPSRAHGTMAAGMLPPSDTSKGLSKEIFARVVDRS